jgi:hypothetical protein
MLNDRLLRGRKGLTGTTNIVETMFWVDGI